MDRNTTAVCVRVLCVLCVHAQHVCTCVCVCAHGMCVHVCRCAYGTCVHEHVCLMCAHVCARTRHACVHVHCVCMHVCLCLGIQVYVSAHGTCVRVCMLAHTCARMPYVCLCVRARVCAHVACVCPAGQRRPTLLKVLCSVAPSSAASCVNGTIIIASHSYALYRQHSRAHSDLEFSWTPSCLRQFR